MKEHVAQCNRVAHFMCFFNCHFGQQKKKKENYAQKKEELNKKLKTIYLVIPQICVHESKCAYEPDNVTNRK